MGAGENIGASFSIDVTDLKNGLQQANRLIRESQSEFKAAAAGMDDWRKSEEGLTARIKSLNKMNEYQREKVRALKEEYKNLEEKGLDPTDKQMVELRTKINKETETLNKNEKELEEDTKALENLGKEEKDAGDEAEKSSNKMKKIGSVAKAAGKVAVAAFGAVTAAVGKMIKGLAEATNEAAQAGDAIDKSSQKMRMSAEDYQKLAYAAELSGTNMATMQKAQIKLQKAGSDLDIVSALKQCADSSDAAAAATEMFGEKTAAELLPMLNQGSAGIEAMMNNAEKYGMVMTNDAVAASAAYEDSLTSLKNTASTVKNNLVSNLLPGLTQVFDGLTMLMSGQEGAEDAIVKGAEDMISSIEKVVPQLMDIVTSVIQSLTKILPKVLTTLISTLVGLMPSLISSLTVILDVLLDAIFNNGAQLAKAATTLIMNVVNLVLSHLKDILQLGIEIILALVDGISEALPELIPAIIDVVIQLCDALLDNLPTLVAAATQIIGSLLDGILKALPKLLRYMPKLIVSMIKAAAKAHGTVLQFGKDLILKLTAPFKNLPKWFKSKFDDVWKKIKDALSGVGKFFGNIITTIENKFKNIPKWFKSKFTDAFKKIKDALSGVGKFFGGIWSTIKGKFDNIPNWFKNKFNSAWDKIKGVFSGVGKFFGGIWSTIKSKFTSIGTKVGAAIGGAFKKAINSVLKTAENVINFLPNSINKLLGTINKLPGVHIDKMKTVSLPRLAKGGLVRDATEAVIGEVPGKHEAVLPLSDKRAMKEIVDSLNEAGGGRSVTINQTNNFSKAHSRRELYEAKKAAERAVRNQLKAARA